ncbi:hypothetical protein Tco_0798177 [Tanacetum coccineum]
MAEVNLRFINISSPIMPRLDVGEGSTALEEDTKPDDEQENMSVSSIMPRVDGEGSAPLEEEDINPDDKQENMSVPIDDEKVEGEYYEFIDRYFYLIKELKISGLAEKAGVDENLIIEEVEFYMKDKWNSFSLDLQDFLQEESNSEVPAYDKDQLHQIVNFIHIIKDIYNAEVTKKISHLGRSEQLNIAAAYRDLIKSVKKMIEDGRNTVAETQ